MVIGAVAVICLVAAWRGHDRFDQYTWYNYDNGDPGHPGVITVLAAIALWTVAVISALLASMLRSRPWVVAASLFFVIGVDYLFRIHNNYSGGDVVARLVYWSVFAYVLRLMWKESTAAAPRVLIVAGLACFALSDLFDLLSNEPYGRGSALEESTGCIGAWCLALATLGIAQLLLARATEPAS